MTNYKNIEERLNFEAKKIIALIKEDFYQYMSDGKKQLINSLIDSNIIVVNQGQNIFNDNTLAHGGRTRKDGKIHFYPDVREFESDEEIIDTCKKIIPHECFHYFLQPDRVEHNSSELEKEMLHYYTEGLVEKETRKFYEKHKDEVDFEKANYGFNINFVNLVQSRLNVGIYEVIFNDDDYLNNILNFVSEYEKNEKKKKELLDIIKEIAQEFPKNMQRRAYNRMKTMILQDGSADTVKNKLKEFNFIKINSIKRLKDNDALEL